MEHQNDSNLHQSHEEGDHHEDHHHDEGFWRKYFFSVDHKTIGIQYGITSLLFLFLGFVLMMLMRWQLAFPDNPLPIIGAAMSSEVYNQFGAMHLSLIHI